MDSNSVLEIFKEITFVPRESGHEEQIVAYLKDWAEKRSLEFKLDEAGNVLITREAAEGYTDKPVIVLQCHQDMVCEKNPGVKHDFAKDPIKYVIENGWMIAKDTTLGADDGIGIAACLALLESKTPTGKIECLFTKSEETGMDGAEGLKEGFFSGKYLINLDSEDEGQLFIGCAGGINTEITFAAEYAPVPDSATAVRLLIGGAQGGHSGDDINKERVNAVQQMVRFLYTRLNDGIRLCAMTGGNKPNAIARDCEAVIATEDPSALMTAFMEFGDVLAAEYHVTDPAVNVEAFVDDMPATAVTAADTRKLVSAMFACPHGVQAMSQDIAGLVETSTNLASVKMSAEGAFVIRTSQRSSVMSERAMIADKVAATFELIGAKVEHLLPYPGWTPNVNSHLLQVCVDSYRKLFDTEPEVKAIHAGLECGLFLDKFPDLDMISFGPTLRGVHAPGEKLELASLDKFVDLLEDVVCNFK